MDNKKDRVLSDTNVSENIIKDQIRSIVTRAVRIRRSTVHWILWDKGMLGRPGGNWSSHSFQLMLNDLYKEGFIGASKTQRATYLKII